VICETMTSIFQLILATMEVQREGPFRPVLRWTTPMGAGLFGADPSRSGSAGVRSRRLECCRLDGKRNTVSSPAMIKHQLRNLQYEKLMERTPKH
jgi:hypothetical protein